MVSLPGLLLMAFRNQMKRSPATKSHRPCTAVACADGLVAPAILKGGLRELPAQLLVIGSQGRIGLSRVALGSVAEAVARSVSRSSLVFSQEILIGGAGKGPK